MITTLNQATKHPLHTELIQALEKIESLERQADGCIGLVDAPHRNALRTAGAIAQQLLYKLEAAEQKKQ